MDKFEELKRDFDKLWDEIKTVSQDRNDFLNFVVAASLRIWAQNELYSPDYAKALLAITGKKYSLEQIVTAMGCCGEEDRPLAVPNWYKAIVEADVSSDTKKGETVVESLNYFLIAVSLINGDFSMQEATALTAVIEMLLRYAKEKGLDIKDPVNTSSYITPLKEDSYLKNDTLTQAAYDEKRPARSEQPDTSGESIGSITINLNIHATDDASAGQMQKEQLPEDGSGVAKREPEEKKAETLDSLLEELDGLVGLDNVKQDVHSLINFIRVSRIRKERGMKVPTISYHLVFTGNPGTGKTTVARLIARLYYQMGILPKGQLVETDRSALVAGYLGQTAIKTQKVIQEAMGGVLFIDEAYSLAGDMEDSYGKEAIETILKAMEDHRDELIVIVAGYTELMHKFIESNPGLSSRFSKYFEFKDYLSTELIAIFQRFCKSNGYVLDDGAKEMLLSHFEKLYAARDEHFGNARTARNLFEKSINAQANRIAAADTFSDFDLETLTVADISEAIGGN